MTADTQLERLQQTLSTCQRKNAKRAQEIVALIDKNANLRHEIARLEDVLAWIYRTEAPDVKDVIARTIPRRLNLQTPEGSPLVQVQPENGET